jgi:hypothetical protein
MSISDYAIEQDEERYQGYDDSAEIDYLQEMERDYYQKTLEDDNLVDNLIDAWQQAEEKDKSLFWEDMK